MMKHLYSIIWILPLCSLLTCTSPGSKKLTPFEEDGKWGYKDGHNRIVISPRFTIANEYLPEGIAAVVDDSSWAYINRKGKIVIRPFIYDNGPDYFQEELARFVTEGKFGFFNKKGEIVIPARFDFVFPFREGLAAFCEGCSILQDGEHQVIRGGKWGFIDKSGKIVIPALYDSVRSFSYGFVSVKMNGKWDYLNKRGEPVSKSKFETIRDFQNRKGESTSTIDSLRRERYEKETPKKHK